jgi:hypothetical protein
MFSLPGIRGIIKFVIDMTVAWMNGGYGSRILIESALRVHGDEVRNHS